MISKLDKELLKQSASTLRRKHLEEAFSYTPPIGHILECGVASGRSFRWLTGLTTRIVHGFDSFEGLPEEWPMSSDIVVAAGAFKYPTPNTLATTAKIHVGLFEDTLPTWSKEYPGMIAFLHIDADIYSSCVTILEKLNHQIVQGTVILFDEIYESIRYKYWEQGEYKAFNEWQIKYNRKVYPLTKSTNGEASFRVIK